MQQPKKLRVAILCGGRSAEHEISLLSARFVIESLDSKLYEPLLIGISKSGEWLFQDVDFLLKSPRDPRQIKLAAEMPAVHLSAYRDPDDVYRLRLADGTALPVDVVFPVLHGPMGEDGTIQGLLEVAGVAYVGAGVLGSAVGMDKDVMKSLLSHAGLPLLPYLTITRPSWADERERILTAAGELGLPLFVKPANLGSSVGVRRVREPTKLRSAIEHAFEFDDKLVVEAGLERPREIECAVLGGDSPSASLPGEIVIDHPDGFYSYAAKYIDDTGATTKVPATVSAETAAQVQKLALLTFKVLQCDGLARVDFFLTNTGELYVNEINTLPGFTEISMFPKLWAASGVPARDLMTRLIDDALTRAARKRKRRTAV